MAYIKEIIKMDTQVKIPAKVAFEIFKHSLFGKFVNLMTLSGGTETNDTYFYVNGKYIYHVFIPKI